MIQTQKSGANSNNIQAGRDLTINYYNLPSELFEQFNHAFINIRNSDDTEKKNILILLENEEFEEAEKALDTLSKRKDSAYAKDMLEIAGLYIPLNKEKADSCYAQAAKTGHDTPWILNEYAIYLMNTGQLDEADSVFEKLLALENFDEKVRELALGNRGVLYKNQGKWQKAIGCLNQAQKLSIRNNNKIIETSNLNNLGACFSNTGNLEQAGIYLTSALEKIDNLLDEPLSDRDLSKLKSIQTNTLSNLSINKKRLFLQTSRTEYLDEAEKHLKRAIDIDQSSGDKAVLIRHHGNLANTYNLKNQQDERRKHLEKARVLSISYGTLKDKLTVKVNLAAADQDEGNTSEALQLYNECFADKRIHNFRRLAAEAFLGLAKVHKVLNDEVQANNCAGQAKKLFSDLELFKQARDVQNAFPHADHSPTTDLK